MDQQKTGRFLKMLRNEKNLTQEQAGERFGVSSRTISRWETGRNLPDISLLVEISDFYGIDVRELIEGERKSDMMNDEAREVARKMADYAGTEKSKLLTVVQIISFAGLIAACISVAFQTYSRYSGPDPGSSSDLALLFSVITLAVMAVIALYVTGRLERLIKAQTTQKVIKAVAIVVLAVSLLRMVILTAAVGLLLLDSFLARPEVYTDYETYTERMSFSATEDNTKWIKWGMDESIWPREITGSMEVIDYKMVYYNPWDAQFLGYLVVDYTDEEYDKEVRRLREYDSTEYIGYYCVEEEHTYELLAVNADPYNGFVYALTDGDRIIYAEQIFCNYTMDLKYSKYIPEEYLLDGFDATTHSPYYKEMTKDR